MARSTLTTTTLAVEGFEMTNQRNKGVLEEDLTDEQRKNISILNESSEEILKKLSEINGVLAANGATISVSDLLFSSVLAERHPLDEISPCCCQNGKYELYCRNCVPV